MATARNHRTGETREVTDAEWEEEGQALRNKGFTLDDEGAKPEAKPEAVDYDALTVDELRSEADGRDLDVTRGDGEDGAPLKADYVRALAKHDRRK